MNKTILCPLILLFLTGIIFVQGAANLEVSIHQNYKQVLAGQDVWAAIKLSDFEQGRKDVILDYWVSDFNGSTIAEKKETVAVETRAEFVKLLNVPENAKQGKYTFHAQVTYADGQETAGKDSFEVITEPVENQVYYVLFVMLFLIIISYILFKPNFLLFLRKIELKMKIRGMIKKRKLNKKSQL